MTVAQTPRKAGPYIGNGVATTFPFDFKVFAKEDIGVVRANDIEIETDLVLDSDYSVVLNADQDANPGGTITYPIMEGAQPLPSGWRITIIGVLPENQETDITNTGRFLPDVFERALDKLTILVQQLKEGMGRSVQVPVSSDTSPKNLIQDLVQAAHDTVVARDEVVNISVHFSDEADQRLDEIQAEGEAILQQTEIAAAVQRAMIQAGADALFASLGYMPPVTYTAGLSMTTPNQTVSYNGETYAPIASQLPFTTSGVFEAGKFRLIQGVSGADLASYLGGVLVKFQLPVSSSMLRTLQDKLFEIVSIKDFGAIGDGTLHPLSERFGTLAAAQAVYPFASALTDSIDWAAWTAARAYFVSLGVPGFIKHPPGEYVANRPLVMNPSLDCATPVDGIANVGQPGHRSYDTPDKLPATWSAVGTFDTLLDLRASRHWAVIGIGFNAPDTIDNVIRFGAEGCANPTSMIRVGTVDRCQVYGAKVALNGYLTSGLHVTTSDFSRSTQQGIRLNSCGDWSAVDNFINTIGPILNGGMGASTYDGAALLAFGGGGSNFIAGGKIEVCSRGIVLDNVQGFIIHSITFDKCKEVAVTISGNQNTSGKTTNLGYQPRGISLSKCHFVGNGWDGAAAHILLSNTGADLEMSIGLIGNTFARGGPNATELDLSCPGGAVFRATSSGTTMTITQMLSGTVAVGQRLAGPNIPVGTTVTALGTSTGGTGTVTISNSISIAADVTVSANAATSAQIYGAGAVRCIRANNSGSGSSSIFIRSVGNGYSGGALSYAMDSFSPRVTFSSTADEFETPVSPTWLFPVVNGGTNSSVRGTKKKLRVSGSWSPPALPAGQSTANADALALAVPGAAFDTPLMVYPPGSMQGMMLFANLASVGNATVRVHNGMTSSLTPPSGTYIVEYDVDAWAV